MLYCRETPVGAVITIVPVGVVQVGWLVTEAVAVATKGIGFTVIFKGAEMQPVALFFTVTL